MKYIFFLFFTFLFFNTYSQIERSDTVQFQVIMDKKPLPGVSVIIRGTMTASITQINGNATLIIPHDKDIIELSYLGPYTELIITRPIDSIYVNINRKKAKLFYKKKKIKTVKISINGY